jgi:hypothetical protein
MIKRVALYELVGSNCVAFLLFRRSASIKDKYRDRLPSETKKYASSQA